jgi:hypothetical protein
MFVVVAKHELPTYPIKIHYLKDGYEPLVAKITGGKLLETLHLCGPIRLNSEFVDRCITGHCLRHCKTGKPLYAEPPPLYLWF